MAVSVSLLSSLSMARFGKIVQIDSELDILYCCKKMPLTSSCRPGEPSAFYEIGRGKHGLRM